MSERAAVKTRTDNAPSLTASGVLQRKCASCGNHTIAGGQCQDCTKKRLQTKLQVNQPGDAYEQEADRIADQVMATPAHTAVSGALPRIQRFSGQSNGQMDAVPASVDRALASPGRPLEPALRKDMENRFGYDFSQVRVHTGAAAEQSARDVKAYAYTAGRDIVFSAGSFAPGTRWGRRLIAHELTHVVQQVGPEGNGLLTPQRAAGDRAVAGGLRTLSIQRDDVEAVANDQWWRVNDGYHSLVVDIGKVNMKIKSPTRSDWLKDLQAYWEQIGAPGDLDATMIGRLEAELANYKKYIDQDVTSAREHWKRLKDEYEKERATLTDGQGLHPRQLKRLEWQFKETENTVYYAYTYLTHDDLDGLQIMLDEKTHITFVEDQELEELWRRRKEASRKVPLFRHFRIRAIVGGQLSVGPAGLDVSTFEIEELGPRGRSGMITFAASGLAKGLKAGAIGPQSWTDFKTTAEMRIEDFEGIGRLTSVSAYLIYGGGYSVLTFFIRNKPTVQVKSWGYGWGLGGGAETIVGTWTVRSVN